MKIISSLNGNEVVHNIDVEADIGAPPVAPVADFTGTPLSGTAPLLVTFTDTSTNTPTSWAWDFENNGSTDSTAQDPTFSYTSAGIYSVKLTATNGSGSGIETKISYITVSAAGSRVIARGVTARGVKV